MTEDAIRRKLAALNEDETIQLSERTRDTYRKLWSYFERWCRQHGHNALPAEPIAVVGYLLHRYESGIMVTTIRSDRNAIASKHRLAGFERPTLDQYVKDCIHVLGRKAKREGRKGKGQAIGLRLEHIEKLTRDTPLLLGETEYDPWTPARASPHARDLALVTVMHSAFLRSQEAADLRWGDVHKLVSGQARITIRQSKTSAEPQTALLTTSAVRRLERIMPENLDMEAPIFGVKTGSAIHRRIAKFCKRVRPGATGHSPRVGAAQDMTIRGGSLHQVKEAGRWRSLAMPAHYASVVS